MLPALPFLLPLMAYPTEAPAAEGLLRVKGAGKWTWAAREALKTLAGKNKVWIQASSDQSARAFAQALLHWQEPPYEAAVAGYELKCFNTETNHLLFGDLSFSQVVGLWLEHAGSDSSSLLSPFISTEGFAFTPAEFIDLRDRLQTTIRRYERLPKVSRGLEDLNTGFFRHRSLEESQEFITSHLTSYLAKGDLLRRDFLLAINKHARAAIFAGRASLREKRLALSHLRRGLQQLEDLRGRAAKKAKKELFANWQAYCQAYPQPPSPSTQETTAWLAAQLREEDEALEQQERQLFRELKSAGLGLNALTVAPGLGDAADLQSLETRGKALLQEVDEAGLYQLPLGGIDAATTQRQLQQLEGLLEKLRNTQHHLSELPAFYDRRQFWYAQPAHLRRIMAPLLTLPAADWLTAFSSWYFERCLEQYPSGINHQPVPAAGTAENTAPAPDHHVNILSAGAPWPTQTAPGDLFISLSPETPLPAAPGCKMLQLAPLQDPDATPIALAGLRDPRLAIFQSFSPLSPPAWRPLAAASAPAGWAADRILVKGAADWHQLATCTFEPAAALHIFLPRTLVTADQELLLQHWEKLLSLAPQVNFYHNFSQDDLTKALLTDGFSGSFLAAALIRAAEAAAATPFDQHAFRAMGREIQYRCGLSVPAPHPLAEQAGRRLATLLPGFFFEYHQPWRDTFLPLVALSPAGKKTVLLPAGKLPGYADRQTETLRQRELHSSGFHCLPLEATAIWEDPDTALKKIARHLGQASGT